MKRGLIFGFAICLVVVAVLVLFLFFKKQKFAKLHIGDVIINVEIVDSALKITRGLSGRKKLLSGTGMLFVFKKEDFYPFWMREMHFDIDLIWIKNGEVVGITPNVPKQQLNISDNELKLYYPPTPVDNVLEINSNDASLLGIEIGDRVLLENR